MEKYIEILFNKIKQKFNIEINSIELIGGFDLDIITDDSIDELIRSNIYSDDLLKEMPFSKNMASREILLFKISQNSFVTVFDSDEMFADPEVLKIYTR